MSSEQWWKKAEGEECRRAVDTRVDRRSTLLIGNSEPDLRFQLFLPPKLPPLVDFRGMAGKTWERGVGGYGSGRQGKADGRSKGLKVGKRKAEGGRRKAEGGGSQKSELEECRCAIDPRVDRRSTLLKGGRLGSAGRVAWEARGGWCVDNQESSSICEQGFPGVPREDFAGLAEGTGRGSVKRRGGLLSGWIASACGAWPCWRGCCHRPRLRRRKSRRCRRCRNCCHRSCRSSRSSRRSSFRRSGGAFPGRH